MGNILHGESYSGNFAHTVSIYSQIQDIDIPLNLIQGSFDTPMGLWHYSADMAVPMSTIHIHSAYHPLSTLMGLQEICI